MDAATKDVWNLPWTGHCRCGAVEVRVDAAPLLISACHCAGCQRMSASAFSLTMTLPADGLHILSGDLVPGGARRDMHHFCRACMTWLFTRPPGLDHIVNLRPSVLDDHGWVRPYIETFARERLPWATTPAQRRFDAAPALEEYETLIAEFAAAGIRPGAQPT